VITRDSNGSPLETVGAHRQVFRYVRGAEDTSERAL
jgi:hypothetical protein